MKIYLETDPSSCKKLWETFSLHKTPWQLWDVAMAFVIPSIHSFYFLVLKEQDNNDGREKTIGILPLVYESTTGDYMYFGCEYMEDLHFWFDLTHFPKVWEALPAHTNLYDVNHHDAEAILKAYPQFTSFCEMKQKHYFIDLAPFSFNLATFWSTFSKKHRKNLLYDLKKFESQQCTLEWSSQVLYFDEFVKFNLNRFGNESDFVDRLFVECMKKFLHWLEEKKYLHVSVITNDKALVGVEYAMFYEGIYYVLNGGYDLAYPNAGKYIIKSHLEKAMALKAKRIDFLSGDSGWKELWNCRSEPYYTFQKRSTTPEDQSQSNVLLKTKECIAKI